MNRRTVVQCSLAAVLGAALSLPALAQPKDKVVLMLNWYTYSEHAPFYLGKAKGFFDEQGIELEIQEGRGSAIAVQAVGAGTVTFAYADVPTMIKAAARGAPVRAIGVALQVSPMAVMGFSDKNVKTPKDIIGKTVATTPGDSPSQLWPLFLKKTGIQESQFSTVSGDAQTKLNAVINGRADVLLGYVMDQNIKLQDAAHKPVTVVRFADYGVNMVSSGIVANKETLAKSPDLVKRFMRAATRSLEEAEKNPEAAVDATLKAQPKSGQRDTMLAGLKLTTALYHTEETSKLPPFRVTMKNVNESLDLLVQYGGMDPATRGKAEDYVSLDYLPQ